MSPSTRSEAPPGEPGAYEVLLLAGGLGTRLREAVPHRPKVVADVRGVPFLAHLLRQVERAGFRDVTLCTGHGASQVEALAGEHAGALRLRVSREEQPLGTGGAVKWALSGRRRAHVVVMNGDSYVHADLAALVSWYAGAGTPAGMVVTWQEDTSRFGRVDQDAGGRVTRFREKAAGAGPGWINAGIYVAEASRLDTLPEGPSSLERDWLPALAEQGQLRAWSARVPFLDIGTPQSYAAAEAFLSGLGRQGP